MSEKVREGEIKKRTKEVEIYAYVNVDGNAKREISTGVGFLDHMLEVFSEFSLFDLKVLAKGDINIDYHHTTEEVGLCVGEAIREAIKDGDIERFGNFFVPLDEALVHFVVDISGRPYTFFSGIDLMNGIYKDITYVFFDGLSRGGKFTTHIRVICGINSHHISEAIFKAGAISLKQATRKRNLMRPSSTKGYLV